MKPVLTVSDILRQPQLLHRKKLKVRGVLDLAVEGPALWESRAHIRPGGPALRIELPPLKFPGDGLRRFHGKHVVVSGTLNAAPQGSFAAALVDVEDLRTFRSTT